MSTITAFVDTPYYLLMDAKRPLGPVVAPLPSGIRCMALYGFSKKEYYDKFCANSPLELSPFPLTKFYLRRQAGVPSEGIALVAVNAVGPNDPCLHAATIDQVLQGQDDDTFHVTAVYRLDFDPDTATYHPTPNEGV